MCRGETATEQWAALWRLRSWPRPAQFPLLDILRLRVLAASTGGEQLTAAQQVFTAQLSPETLPDSVEKKSEQVSIHLNVFDDFEKVL